MKTLYVRNTLFEDSITCPHCGEKHVVKSIVSGEMLAFVKDFLIKESVKRSECVIDVWRKRTKD